MGGISISFLFESFVRIGSSKSTVSCLPIHLIHKLERGKH